MTKNKPNLEVDLATLLTAAESDDACATCDSGDIALLERRYEDAIDAYAKVRNPSETIRAKHGYALAAAGQVGAVALLTCGNVGSHPTARAVLAWAIRWEHPNWYGSRNDLREGIKALLQSVLDAEHPSQVAMYVLLEMWFDVQSGREGLLEQAIRARTLYPCMDHFLGVLAREQRIANTLPQSSLALLEEAVRTTGNVDVLVEACQWAIALKQWELADLVLERIREAINAASDDQQDLAMLSAFVDLQRGRAGDISAARRGWGTIKPWLATFPEQGGEGRRMERALEVDAIALCLAAELDDSALVIEAAKCVIAVAYAPSFTSTALMDFAFLAFDLQGFRDRVRIELDLPLSEYHSRIIKSLGMGESTYYRLLRACRAVEDGRETEKDLEAICGDGPHWGPVCELETIASVLISSEADELDGLGTLLARVSVVAEGRPGDTALHARLDHQREALYGLDDEQFRQVFDHALLVMDEQDVGTGARVLEHWGELLQNRAPDLLTRFAKRFEARTGLSAPLPPPPPDPLTQALGAYPGPDECPSDPADLSLLQAAVLVAVLRGEIDHSGWTVAPLNADNGPFEPEAPEHPQRRFIQALFDLAKRGVLGFSDKTATGVLTVMDDGRLAAHLDRVVWSISPKTLALQRSIRDLPHDHWPDAWRESAPVLARDLGAQELLAYMIHLCNQRMLPLPEPDELLPEFRELLERRSVAHGYYLVHKTVREALDYQAKYRAGERQVSTRMQKLLRGNIERSLEQGWDTQYRRDHGIKQSQLFSALHDVLTGWGQRAFDEPVYDLPLP